MCKHPESVKVEVCGEVVCGACAEAALMAEPAKSFRPAKPFSEVHLDKMDRRTRHAGMGKR